MSLEEVIKTGNKLLNSKQKSQKCSPGTKVDNKKKIDKISRIEIENFEEESSDYELSDLD